MEMFLHIQCQCNFLTAAEVHLDGCEYAAAVWPLQDEAQLAPVRHQVKCLGIHLPYTEYTDLHPLSANEPIRRASMEVLRQSIDFAAAARADYVVFHARSNEHDYQMLKLMPGTNSQGVQHRCHAEVVPLSFAYSSSTHSNIILS